jgi:hypothetical protein
MPLFDMYVMVDWSGSDRRRAGRPDCIWIAHGSAEASAPITISPPSRTEAEQIIPARSCRLSRETKAAYYSAPILGMAIQPASHHY